MMMRTRKEVMLWAILAVILSFVTQTFGYNFQPIQFTLPSPPQLVGPLAPNTALQNAEKVQENKISGTASFAFHNADVYTITRDGKVVNIAPCTPKVIATLAPAGCKDWAQCGLLTSIRLDITKKFLLVLDAYRGLFSVSLENGAVKQLFSSNTLVAGRASKYLSDFVQNAHGTVLIGDASDQWTIQEYLYIIMEGRPTGRIIAVDPRNGKALEFMKNIVYPDGLEITPDGSKVLVAEAGKARILSFGIIKSNLRQMTVFSDNLPGCPTKIRRTSRGTYWVGLNLVRHAGIANSMDYYSNNPAARLNTLKADSLTKIRTYYPQYGIAVEISANGQALRTFQDPSGRSYNSVIEAIEHEGVMYIAHYGKNYAGRLITANNEMTVDSTLQVLRSRCKVDESKLDVARQAIQKFLDTIRNKGTTPPKTPEKNTPPQKTPDKTTPEKKTPDETNQKKALEDEKKKAEGALKEKTELVNKALEKQKKAMDDLLVEKKKEKDDVEKEQEDIKKKMEKNADELKKKQDALQAVEASLDAKRRQLAADKLQYNGIPDKNSNEAKALDSKIKTADNDLKATESAMEKVKEEMKKLNEDTRTQLEKKVTGLEKLRELGKKIPELEEQRKTLDKEGLTKERATKDKEALKKTLDEKRKALETEEKTLEDLKVTKKEKQKALEDARPRLEAVKKTIEVKETALADMKTAEAKLAPGAEKDAKKTEIKALQDSIDTLKNDKKKVEEEMEKLEGDINKASRNMIKAMLSMLALKREIPETEEKIKAQDDMIKTVGEKEELEAKVKDLDEKIKKLG